MIDVAHAFGLLEERTAIRVSLVQGTIVLSQHMRDKGDKRAEVHVDTDAAIAIVCAHESVPEEGRMRLERSVVQVEAETVEVELAKHGDRPRVSLPEGMREPHIGDEPGKMGEVGIAHSRPAV